jgi:hypothetical protein
LETSNKNKNICAVVEAIAIKTGNFAGISISKLVLNYELWDRIEE